MRQFIVETPLDSNGCICIEGKKYHYLNSVLRVKCGDMIYARLLDGSLQQMTVAKIDSCEKKIILQVAGKLNCNNSVLQAIPVLKKPKTEIYLFQFEAKPPKMDLIIRQATECGVCGIIPVEGEFCQKGIYNALKNADVIKKENAKIAVAVGAEGGISVQEISMMKESGFIPVHFDTNILRCETASLYGIAALQTALSGE